MSKLPKVVIFGTLLGKEQFAQKDYTVLSCHEDDKNAQEVISKYSPDILLSIGERADRFTVLQSFPLWRKKGWLHFDKEEKIDDNLVLYCYMHNILLPKRELVSVFTTTYKSKTKILRPFRSLRAQTYQDWEWIIVDDSDDNGETYRMLEALAEKEPRIRLYKPKAHSGYIGAVKKDAASMSRGTIIVELDHDDDVLPETLQLLVDVYKSDPKIGFVYSDFTEIFDDGANWKYSEFYCFGYGSYTKTLVNGRWVNHAMSPPINPQTFSHIVGVPNHIRSWRASAYFEVGGHNSGLWVADDYELVLRTFGAGWKFCRIPQCLYLQYRNRVDNNFTFLRNREIQKLTGLISVQYANVRESRFKSLGFDGYQYKEAKVWELEDEVLVGQKLTKKAELVWNPNPNRVAVVLVASGKPELIKGAIRSVMDQTYTDFELYIIWNKDPEADRIMDADEFKKPQVHWWNLETKQDDTSVLRNYALINLVTVPWVAYLDAHKKWTSQHLEVCMKEVHDASFVQIGSSASGLFHKADLIKYGYWKRATKTGYAPEKELVERWKAAGEKGVITDKNTVVSR